MIVNSNYKNRRIIIKTKQIKEINVLNDAMFKSLFRSIEARGVVASFLSSLTGINKEILFNAEYQGGELPKKILKEKGKTSDVIIKVDDGNKLIIEMNQEYTDKIFEKNTSYAFSIASETILSGTKKYPKVILINFDNIFPTSICAVPLSISPNMFNGNLNISTTPAHVVVKKDIFLNCPLSISLLKNVKEPVKFMTTIS